ncbi:MAG: hypothetical protein KatS3mg052_2702 [Candidatus Roseilinea sp.]|nr:MAG: hypothetical protein KatS3mg052_2702 [Candidatus Roseilinea sp.]
MQASACQMGTQAKAGVTTCFSLPQARGLMRNFGLLRVMGTQAKAGVTTCFSLPQARRLEPVSRSATNGLKPMLRDNG